MQGCGKGVAGFINRQYPHVLMIGCACHLLHIAAERASRELTVCIEDMLIAIYYYLDKSSKRKAVLNDVQKLCDADVKKILKYCSTRWLSLGQCVTRLLDQWEPLTVFFAAEAKNVKKKCGTKSVAVKSSVTVSKSQTHRSQSVNNMRPSESKSQPYRSQSVDTSKPSASKSQTHCIKSVDTSKPSASKSKTHCIKSVDTSKPSASKSKTHCIKSVDTSKPSALKSQKHCIKSLDTSKPSSSKSQTHCIKSIDTSKPSASKSQTHCIKSVDTSKPSASKSQTHRSKSVDTSKPSTSKSQTHRSKSVDNSQPTESKSHKSLNQTVNKTPINVMKSSVTHESKSSDTISVRPCVRVQYQLYLNLLMNLTM